LHGEALPESLFCPPVEWVDFFHCRNVGYQSVQDHYTADKLMGLKKYDWVSAHLDHFAEADRKLAKELSQASLQCPNLVGGFVDDFSSSVVEAGRLYRKPLQRPVTGRLEPGLRAVACGRELAE
jgi:hypothetical protein